MISPRHRAASIGESGRTLFNSIPLLEGAGNLFGGF